MNEIVRAKVGQAVELLRELDLPLWIAQFARETGDHPELVQGLVVGMSVTWPAAFVITAAGETTAIVGTGDRSSARDLGAYADVVGYVHDVGPPLLDLLRRHDPARIGLSFSVDDDTADNMTHGMYLQLERILAGTSYAGRLTSAAPVLSALRARKLPVELDRIRAAIESTHTLLARVPDLLQIGASERSVADAVRREIEQAGLGLAWDAAHNPIVNFGATSSTGHAAPGDTRLDAGMLAHIDVGVQREGYRSDLQRTWYILEEDEETAPADVQRAFSTVLRSMQEGYRALRPGIAGWEVDAVARSVIVDAGYDEPEFAFGHQLGQLAHDGGGLLGPRWPRYGARPEVPLEAGNVFTIEFGLPTRAGAIGLEEDVVVTSDGAEYLSSPQTELVCLRR
ncbi:MAG TPA: Xaa-Pro peptidase family protein [Chloroflexota bacterium]|nr:Xaa-Pro peptidase family protein [Chloroflexota bacterium]